MHSLSFHPAAVRHPGSRKLFLSAILVLAFACTSLLGAETPKAATDPLLFPKDRFTLDTKTIKTAAGEKKVVYRSYRHILYVTKPILGSLGRRRSLLTARRFRQQPAL